MSDEIEHETILSREEVADYLEDVAEGFRSGEEFSLTIGEQTFDVNPATNVEFEVELEDEEDERELEFEIEWDRHDEGSELSVE
jgi:amphi-Trp domain-containing protein